MSSTDNSTSYLISEFGAGNDTVAHNSTSYLVSTPGVANDTATTLSSSVWSVAGNSTSYLMSTPGVVNDTAILSTSVLGVSSSLPPVTLSDSTTFYEMYDYAYNPDEVTYPGYPFERIIYLYVWEILVLVTAIVNILVVSVLLRKSIRNPTNMILAAIAISDSMTGLVTLPTYIMVYNNYRPPPDLDETHEMLRFQLEQLNNTDLNLENHLQESYVLTKDLCRAFMISKLFLSKFFHTVSIFLTLFLAFQRFISVAYPFKAQIWFHTKRIVMVCVVIFLLSPLMHVYHLQNEKALYGLCQWRAGNDCSNGECAFLWIVLFVRHLIPCFLLVTITALFIRMIRKSRIELNQEQTRRRAEENRRVSIIVVMIVIVFLVPEIPYTVFLISFIANKYSVTEFDSEQYRAIHAIYEISLVLSFHANFYIYIFLNKRFYAGLKQTILFPIGKALGRPVRWTLSRSFRSRYDLSRRTTSSDITSNLATELHLVRSNTTGSRRTTLETNNKLEQRDFQ